MSAIKDGRFPVVINEKEHHLLFSLNALDEIQDKFGGYDKLGEVFNSSNPSWIKDTKWLLTLLINEGAEDGEPELTEKQVGKMIHTGNIKDVQNAIYAAFAVGNSGDKQTETEEDETEENEEDDEGNATSAQEN